MKDSGAIHCLSFCNNSAEEFCKNTRTKKRRLSRGEIISFSLLWSKSAERSILFACENECTHFHNRGSRERSSFVRSRVKSRPGRRVACDTPYWVFIVTAASFMASKMALPRTKILKKLKQLTTFFRAKENYFYASITP